MMDDGGARTPSRAVKTLFGLAGLDHASYDDDEVSALASTRSRSTRAPTSRSGARRDPSPASTKGRRTPSRAPWYPPSHRGAAVPGAEPRSAKRPPRPLSFNVEALQKDHAIIVDEVIEQLTRGNALSVASLSIGEPAKFGAIYDRLRAELERVSDDAAATDADAARARDVQHILSIVFSLVEHERSSFMFSMSSLRDTVRRREGRLAARSREELSVGLRRRLGAGARLLTALTRVLIEERPQRRAFGRWARFGAVAESRNSAQRSALAVERLRDSQRRHDEDARRIEELEVALARAVGFADRGLSRSEAARDAAVARVRRRWLRVLESRALLGWRALASERIRLRRFWRRCLRRMAKGRVAVAFGTWRAQAAKIALSLRDVQRHKRALDRCRRRWTHARSGRALSSWMAFIAARRRARRVVKRCGARLTGHAVAPAFRSWVVWVADDRAGGARKAARSRAVDRCRRRWLHARVGAAYSGWLTHVGERKRLRALVMRCLGALRHDGLGRGFRKWLENLRLRDATAALRAHRAQLMDRFRRRWVASKANAAYRAWEYFARDRRRLRRLAKRCVRRMRHATLGPALRAWYEAGLVMKRNEVALDRVARRWLNARLLRTVNGWRHFIRERKRLRLLVVRAVGFAVHGVLGPAFGRWRRSVERAMAAELEEFRDRADDLGGRLEARQSELEKVLAARRDAKRASAHGLFAAWAGKATARVWYAWLSSFRARRERSLTLESRAVKAMRNAFSFKAFRGWRAFREERRRLRGAVRRSVARFHKATVAPAFRSWIEFVDRLDAADARAKRRLTTIDAFRRRFMHALEGRAFHGWRAGAFERVRLRSLVRRAVSRFREMARAPALRQWIAATDAARAGERLDRVRSGAVDRCRRRLRHQLAGRALRGWAAGAAERKRVRRFLRKVVARLGSTTRPLGRALRQWALASAAFLVEARAADAAAADGRRRIALADRIRRRIRNSLAHRALNAWVANAAERRRVRGIVRRCLARARYGELAPGFRGWREGVAAVALAEARARRDAGILERVAARLRNRCAARAFEGWYVGARERRRLRYLARRAVARIRTAATAPAFRSWVAFLDAARRAEGDAIRAETVLDQVRRRLTQRLASRALNAWVHTVAERRRLRGVMRRSLGRVAAAGLGRAFGTWATACRTARRNEVVVDRVARRMRSGVAGRALRGWRANVADRVRLRGNVRRILHRLLGSNLGPAFRTLRDNALRRRKHEVLVKRAALRILCRTLTKAFGAWAANAALRIRVRGLIARVAARAKNGDLARGFGSWRNFAVAARRDAADAAAEAIRREGRVYRLAQSVLWRGRRAVASAYFTTWRRAAHADLRSALHAEVARTAHLLDGARSREATERERRALRLWTGGITGRVWTAWASAVRVWKRQRVVLFRYRCRWIHKICFHVLVTWDRMRGERKRARATLRRIFASSAAGAKVRAMRLWHAFSDAARFDARAEKSHALIVDRVRRRWLSRTSTRAYEAWASFAAERRRLRLLAGRVARRMEHRAVAPSFCTWRDAMVKARHDEGVLAHARLRLRHSLFFKAWGGWGAFVDERKRLRSLLAHAAARFLAGKLSRAFRALLLHAEGDAHMEAERRRREIVVDRCRRRLRHSHAARALSAWVHHAQGRRRARALVRRATKRFAGDALAPAMGKWKLAVLEFTYAVDEAKRVALVVHRVRAKMVHGRSARALRAWTESVRVRKWLRMLVRRVIARFSEASLAPALRSWRLFVEAARAAEKDANRHAVVLDRCRRRMRHATAARAYGSWVAFARDTRRLRALARRILGRLASGLLGPAWRAWRRGAADAAASARDDARRAAIVDRARRRLRHALSFRAWHAWTHFLEARRAARATVTRACARLERRGKAPAFRSWVLFSSDAEAYEARLRRHDAIVTRCRKRFMHGTLARAYAGWTFHAADRARARRLARRVLGRMRHGLEGLGFRRWHDAVAAERVERARDVLAAARSAAKYWARAGEHRSDLRLRRCAFGALVQLRRQRAAGRARAARWKQARGRGHRAACFRAWHAFRRAREMARDLRGIPTDSRYPQHECSGTIPSGDFSPVFETLGSEDEWSKNRGK